MNKKKKILAFMLCALLCSAIALSTQFIIVERHHECTGADCPICMEIQACEQLLKTIGNGFCAVILMSAAVVLLMHVVICLREVSRSHTLVLWKVKLTN